VIPILAYFTAALTFGVGYVLGRRACPEDETYNRGWLDGYEIGKRVPKMDAPADEPVPPMVETNALKPAKRQVTRKPRVKK
jgi:hypothetical protein